MVNKHTIAPCPNEHVYAKAILEAQASGAFIPVLQRNPAWEPNLWGDAYEVVSIEHLCPNLCEEIAPAKTALDYGDLCRDILDQASRTDGATQKTGTVIALDGPASLCAAYLATHFAARTLSGGPDILRQTLKQPNDFTIVVLDRRSASDDLLFMVLDTQRAQLTSCRPWGDLAPITLVLGRDTPSVSWMVAKLIAARRESAVKSPVFRLYSTLKDDCYVDELKLQQEALTKEIADFQTSGFQKGSTLMALYEQPVDVAAVIAHGFDSCANGGSGIVLCGQPAQGVQLPGQYSKALACTHNHPCPRGPSPLPLERMPTDYLMLGICNGIRMADSVLRDELSLALSFLDGPSRGYTSTLFANIGTFATGIAFLSALASGKSLGEATTLLNALLLSSKLDTPTYLTVGDPSHRFVKFDSKCKTSTPGQRISAHEQPTYMIECLTTNSKAVTLAQQGRLVIEIEGSSESSPIYWICRLEENFLPGASEPTTLMRLFFFRFPAPLRQLIWHVHDCHAQRDKLYAAVLDLKRWREIWRLSGVSTQNIDSYRQLRIIEEQAQIRGAEILAASAYDGGVTTRLKRLLQQVEQHCAETRDQVIAEILPGLASTYWLSNVIASAFRTEQISRSQCDACGCRVIRKHLKHSYSSEQRTIDVCARCGIVHDTRPDSDIHRIRMEADQMAYAGQHYEVRVSLDVSETTETVLIYPRLSTLGQYDIEPVPGFGRWNQGNQQPIVFAFKLPIDLRPHRFFIKVFAATSRDLAFASRVFFVSDEHITIRCNMS